jgi:hypothetical protein
MTVSAPVRRRTERRRGPRQGFAMESFFLRWTSPDLLKTFARPIATNTRPITEKRTMGAPSRSSLEVAADCQRCSVERAMTKRCPV